MNKLGLLYPGHFELYRTYVLKESQTQGSGGIQWQGRPTWGLQEVTMSAS
jgi:hypothetical protein